MDELNTCPECGFEGRRWWEENNDFEYVNGCIECRWTRVECPECENEFSYIL